MNLKRFNSVIVHRGAGKTELALQMLIAEALINPGEYAFTCPYQSQLKRNVKWNTLSFPNCEKHDQNSSITTSNGSTIWFLGLDNAESIRGVHLKGLVIDEAKDVKNLLDVWTDILKKCLMVYNGWSLIIGTPKGQGPHKQLHEQMEFQKIYPATITGLLTPEQLELEKKQDVALGKETSFRQEMLCEWLANEDNWFIPEHITRAIKPYHNPVAPYYIGIDLGKKEDFTVVVVFDGENHMVDMLRFNNKDWDAAKDKIISFVRKYPKAQCLCDATSLQDFLVDDLAIEKDVDVRPFQFTNESKKQILEKMKGYMAQELIFFKNEPIFIEELQDFEYTIDRETRRMKFGAPSGKHDDCVMAAAMAISLLDGNTKVYPDEAIIGAQMAAKHITEPKIVTYV